MNLATIRYGDTGPALVARALKRFDAEAAAVKWQTFCPVNYRDVVEITRPPGTLSLHSLKRALRGRPLLWMGAETHAVHLWNEMWRQRGLDKDARYDQRSMYEQLKQKYLAISQPLSRAHQ